MNRLLAAAVVGLLTAGAALADLPPPPPPKGKKYVSVSNEVVLGKDVSGYVFVQQVGAGPGRPKFTHRKLELTPGKATAMASGGRHLHVSLLAVPQDAAREFKTDADLFAALEANKVKGVHSLGFGDATLVPDKVEGNSVKWTHTITAIDKDGIIKKVEGEGAKQPAGRPGEKDRPLAGAGTLVAGLAACAAILLGGLWLVGRARRKV